MKLEEMKRIGDARTKGIWFNDKYRRTIVLSRQAKPWNIFKYPMRTSDYPISHEEYEANPDFVVMAANNWDKLMAVVDAAKATPKDRRWTEEEIVGAVERLKSAVKALDEEDETDELSIVNKAVEEFIQEQLRK